MPEITLTLDQVIEAVRRLIPAERDELLRQIRENAPPRISYEEWRTEVRKIQDMLAKLPGSLSDMIIEDREDRI